MGVVCASMVPIMSGIAKSFFTALTIRSFVAQIHCAKWVRALVRTLEGKKEGMLESNSGNCRAAVARNYE